MVKNGIMYADDGLEIKIGDRLVHESGCEVIVYADENLNLVGKLASPCVQLCENIDIKLDNGDGYRHYVYGTNGMQKTKGRDRAIAMGRLVDGITAIAFTNTDKSVIIRTVGKDGTVRSYASDHFLHKVESVFDGIERLQVELVSDVVSGEWKIECVCEVNLNENQAGEWF